MATRSTTDTAGPVLKEHAAAGHHGQTPIGQLCRQLLLSLRSTIRSGQDLEAVVSRGSARVIVEATHELHEAKLGSDLRPACHGDSRKAVGEVRPGSK